MSSYFDPAILSSEDRLIAEMMVGERINSPDFIIAPDGNPYIYRWYIVPRNMVGNVYFHIQVSDDPERPLHDHPWDNTSVILAGGYREWLSACVSRDLTPGMTVHRSAEMRHRLQLLGAYSMSLFTTGPKLRTWGFYAETGFVPHYEWVEIVDGKSINKRVR